MSGYLTTWSWKTSSSAPSWPDVEGSGLSVARLDSKSKHSNPGWREAIANLQSATGPYSRSITEVEPPTVFGSALSAVASQNFALKPVTLSGTGHLGNYSSAADPSSQIAIAQVSALANFYNSANGDSTGLLIAAELGKTLNMFNPKVNSMIKLSIAFYKRFRRIQSYSTKKKIELINNAYLEWTYGMNPLMKDCEDIHSSLSDIVNNITVRHDHGFGTSEATTLTTSVQTYGVGYFSLRYLRKTKIRAKVNIDGGRIVDVSGFLPNLRNNGFNLASVPSTLWELVPYSFVIDYVSNIGDIISAITGTNQAFYFTSCSTKTEVEVELIPLSGTSTVVGSKGKLLYAAVNGKATKMTFTRTASLPSVGYHHLIPRFHLPSIKQDFNLASLALAYGLRRSP